MVINEVGSLRCDGVGVIMCDLSAIQSWIKRQVTSSIREPGPGHSLDLAEREAMDSPGMMCICLPVTLSFLPKCFFLMRSPRALMVSIPLPHTFGLDMTTFEPWDGVGLGFLWGQESKCNSPSYCVIGSTDSHVGWRCGSLDRVSRMH